MLLHPAATTASRAIPHAAGTSQAETRRDIVRLLDRRSEACRPLGMSSLFVACRAWMRYKYALCAPLIPAVSPFF